MTINYYSYSYIRAAPSRLVRIQFDNNYGRLDAAQCTALFCESCGAMIMRIVVYRYGIIDDPKAIYYARTYLSTRDIVEQFKK